MTRTRRIVETLTTVENLKVDAISLRIAICNEASLELLDATILLAFHSEYVVGVHEVSSGRHAAS